MMFPFNFLNMKILKVHFHFFLFIFRNFVGFCFKIGMIFKQFFHRNIIGKSLDVVFLVDFFSFSFDFSIFQQFFQECFPKQEWKN
jgi:hypothetical protein